VTVLAPHEASLPEHETIRGVAVRRFRYLPQRYEKVAYGDGIVENVRRKPLAVLGLLPFVLAVRRSTKLLSRDCDLIHVHWGPTAALAAPWRTSKPYVLTLHGSDVTLARHGRTWRAMLRRALDRAAGVAVVAEDQRTFLLESGLRPPHRPLVVIPAGVTEDLLARPRGLPTGARFRFLFVGRLVETKGVLDLLSAFAVVRSRGVDAELDLVGAGPLEHAVQEHAKTGEQSERIRVHGALPHDAALEAIAAADALVLPSYGEGSPLVVAEALSLGTPVIGTRVGAIPDVLGADGLLVEPGDVDSLATCMERLATGEDLWKRLSEAGRATAADRLGWDTIAESTVDLYRAAMDSGAAGAGEVARHG
jgi:glycosyltransferase involved in cell wall biosynthesis